MYINDYQIATRKTAIYPRPDQLHALLYCALGLTGESGEVAEKIKKYYRDGIFDRDLFMKELGDVFWYLCRLADELNISASEILRMNLQKLDDRQDRGQLGGSGDTR